jgi:hypothetical protein
MGYLDNSSITVDAVLTKKGREILKDGGNLNITKFSLTDTGVDYTLWNPDDATGSAYYGEAIENLPMLEASVHAEYNLRNRLISLNQTSVAIPALTIDGGLDSHNGTVKTFNDGDEASGTITVRLVGYTSNQSLGFGVLIQNPHIISTTANATGGISGTGLSRVFLSEEDIPAAQEYHIPAKTQGSDRLGALTIHPIQQDTAGKETNIYIVDYETGAHIYFRIVNNITKSATSLLSSGGTGATT